MYVYQKRKEDDLLIAQWWAKMEALGDLGLLFAKEPTLSELYAHIAPPKVLLYEADDELGIWFVAHIEPIFSGAFFGVWVDPSRRGSKSERQAFFNAATAGLQQFGNILIGITKQEKLLSLHRHLGYTVIGEVPKIWNGASAWIMILTKETLLVDQRERKHEPRTGRTIQ